MIGRIVGIIIIIIIIMINIPFARENFGSCYSCVGRKYLYIRPATVKNPFYWPWSGSSCFNDAITPENNDKPMNLKSPLNDTKFQPSGKPYHQFTPDHDLKTN